MLFYRTVFCCLALLLASVTHAVSKEPLLIQYEGFKLWLDCDQRAAVKFEYLATKDTGNHKRHSRFYTDPNVPSRCQQTSTKSYKTDQARYDRGHLIPANHVDYSSTAIRQSNTMINVLPQASNMNRGAWLRTEEITECYRDIEDVKVVGGIIWGNHPEDDYFVSSHGVKTPDAFWKVLIRKDRVIAWIIPNAAEASYKTLDRYIVSLDALTAITGEVFEVADWLKHEKPATSWLIPMGCNKG